MRTDPRSSDQIPPDLLRNDDGRLHAICVRPVGPFQRFDDHLTTIATRFARVLRVTIVRSWDFAAHHDWSGFVSRSVPTVLLVRAGRVVGTCVGEIQRMDVEALLRPVAAV
jgi:hypothetical protein